LSPGRTGSIKNKKKIPARKRMAINGFLKLKELLVGWEAKKERKHASVCLSHVAIPEVKVHFLYSLFNFWHKRAFIFALLAE